MSEPGFPFSDFGNESFSLDHQLALFYRSLPAKLETEADDEPQSSDDLIQLTENTFRVARINARFYEDTLSDPERGPQDALRAMTVAVGFFVEAHYAHKAGESGHSIQALLKANYYLGIANTYEAFARNAKKGGQVNRDKRLMLASAATSAAHRLIGKYKGALAFKYIASTIARDPLVIAANKALGEKAAANLAGTLADWAESDTKWPDFREAVLRIQDALKNRG